MVGVGNTKKRAKISLIGCGGDGSTAALTEVLNKGVCGMWEILVA